MTATTSAASTPAPATSSVMTRRDMGEDYALFTHSLSPPLNT